MSFIFHFFIFCLLSFSFLFSSDALLRWGFGKEKNKQRFEKKIEGGG